MSEIVYLTHNNTIDLLLKSDGVAQDLASVTKITATFGTTTITSNNKTTGAIKWNNVGYDTGEIRLDLGGQAIAAGDYYVPIVVYDTINTLGVVWDYITIQVKADVDF
jgi:hypothetical protein